VSLRLYEIALARNGSETRVVHVMSETDVQAGDAAAPLMAEGDSILSITEIPDDGTARVDAPPPRSQAAEFAPVTRGAAAAPDRSE
jgi:hypothetical protein